MVDMQRFRDDLASRFGVANVVMTEAELIAFMDRFRPAGSGPLPASIPGFVQWPLPTYEQDTVDAIRHGFLMFARRYRCVPSLFNLVLTNCLYWWDPTHTQLVAHNQAGMPGSRACALTDTQAATGPNIFLLLQNIDDTVRASSPLVTALENEQDRADLQFYRYRNDARTGLDAPRGALGYRAMLERTLVHEQHHVFCPDAASDPMHDAFRRHAGWIGPYYTGPSNSAPVPAARKYDVGEPTVRAFVDGATSAALAAPAPASLNPFMFEQRHMIWPPTPATNPGQPWSSARIEQPISHYCLDAPDEDFCETGAAYCFDPERLLLRSPRAYAFARAWLRPDVLRAHPLAFPVATGWVPTAVAP